MDTSQLSPTSSLVRVMDDGEAKLAWWHDDVLSDLSPKTLDALLGLSRSEIHDWLSPERAGELPELDLNAVVMLAPAENQEVWAAGVTYRRSREARIEEATARDVYAKVYRAERPELFFKSAGWRVVPHNGAVGIRSDSAWNVPEPELALLANRHAEVIAYGCANDMSSRSIEGENPLYLPQAKIYDRSCAIGPAAVLAKDVDVKACDIRLVIERDGTEIYAETASIRGLVRDPDALVRVLFSAYTLPVGAWLLTGTPIVPSSTYSAREGDVITVSIDSLGRLVNVVQGVQHSGASAPPLERQKSALEHGRRKDVRRQ